MGKWPWVGREIIKYDTENVFNKKMGILGFITFLQRNMAVPGSPVVRTPYFQCRGPASILVVQLGHEKYMYIRWDTTSQFNYRMSEDNMVFSSIQSFIRVRLCDPMNCSTPGLPAHHQLPESTQTHVHWVGNAIQPSHILSSPSPPSLKLSQSQGLSKWVNSSHQVSKVLKFQLQHSPSNEHPGLISFRMDWLDLLAVQRTLKSFLLFRIRYFI